MTLESEGFIHCSTWLQLPRTAKRFYADLAEPLVALVMDEDAVRGRAPRSGTRATTSSSRTSTARSTPPGCRRGPRASRRAGSPSSERLRVSGFQRAGARRDDAGRGSGTMRLRRPRRSAAPPSGARSAGRGP
ncbi:DUF952 domain-containing protein [Demequina salsinemoris]|uniref:DUF952 domain-containing protein n=1 Tax=Demequina salsinemoris TaxID=577470 RepID=UPI0034E246F7